MAQPAQLTTPAAPRPAPTESLQLRLARFTSTLGTSLTATGISSIACARLYNIVSKLSSEVRSSDEVWSIKKHKIIRSDMRKGREMLKSGMTGSGLSLVDSTTVLRLLAQAGDLFVHFTLVCPRLPLELISEILRHVQQDAPEATLRSCALVDSTWCQVAQTLLFAEITTWDASQLICFHKTLQRNPTLAGYVRKLEAFGTSNVKSHQALPEVLHRLSNLKILTLQFEQKRGLPSAALNGFEHLVSLTLDTSTFPPLALPNMRHLKHLQLSSSQLDDQVLASSDDVLRRLISLHLDELAVDPAYALPFVQHRAENLRFLRLSFFDMNGSGDEAKIVQWITLLPFLASLYGLAVNTASQLVPSQELLSSLPPQLAILHLTVDICDDDDPHLPFSTFGSVLLEKLRANALPGSLTTTRLSLTDEYGDNISDEPVFGITEEVQIECRRVGMKIVLGDVDRRALVMKTVFEEEA